MRCFNKGKADLATGAIASSTYGYFDNPIPETSKSFEAGFDVSFFDSSLNWDLTYYHTGLYNNYFLQATTGGKSKPVNTGLICNQGIETTVSYSLGFAKRLDVAYFGEFLVQRQQDCKDIQR